MSYTLEINLPNLDEGADVEVDKLGIFANGGTYEISPEEADHFLSQHGRTLGEAFLGHPHIKALDPDEEEVEDEPPPLDLNELPDEALQEMAVAKGLEPAGTREELIAQLNEGEGN